MKTARQQLAEKAFSTTVCVAPSHTIFQTLQVMAEWNVGAVLVVEGECLVGIFSERDYARRVILSGKSSATTLVADVMTRCVLCVKPETRVSECLALMTEKHVRHLPVKEGGKVLGLLSIGDLVRATIAEQQFTIEQLESYIYK